MKHYFRYSLALACLLWAFAASAQTTAHPDEHVVILGDSNVWLGGDSCSNHKGWIAWFKDLYAPASCRSYARSGASWSHTVNTKLNPEQDTAVLDDDNVIYNQVVRLIQAANSGEQPDPTLILIQAGGNDAWFAHKRPLEFCLSIDDAFSSPADRLLHTPANEVLSLPQAIRYDCTLLRQAFPAARIVLLTPMQMRTVEPQMLSRVAKTIQQAGWRLRLDTIRLDGSNIIDRQQELKEHRLTYDGTHTTEEGAKHIGIFVAEKLK